MGALTQVRVLGGTIGLAIWYPYFPPSHLFSSRSLTRFSPQLNHLEQLRQIQASRHNHAVTAFQYLKFSHDDRDADTGTTSGRANDLCRRIRHTDAYHDNI